MAQTPVDKVGKMSRLVVPCPVVHQLRRFLATCGLEPGWLRMDALREFLEDLKAKQLAQGNLLGLLHLLIGRRISKADGTIISSGFTWRELANVLKKYRWDVNGVQELGINADDLPPRDRQRFWYAVVVRAGVDSTAAAEAGERLAAALRKEGYTVSAAPK
jgi:hypothetical protein